MPRQSNCLYLCICNSVFCIFVILYLCHHRKTWAAPPGDLRAKTIRLEIDQNLQREGKAKKLQREDLAGNCARQILSGTIHPKTKQVFQFKSLKGIDQNLQREVLAGNCARQILNMIAEGICSY